MPRPLPLLLGLLAAFLVASISLLPPADPPAPEPTPTPSPTPAPSLTPTPRPAWGGARLYGYLPYWLMDRQVGDYLAQVPLSDLALFSVSSGPDGRLDRTGSGWSRVVGAKGRALVAAAATRATRTELVWTSFGPSKNRAFFGDPERWTPTIRDLVALAAKGGFAGVNVDVELLDEDLVGAYGEFVARLRAALDARIAGASLSAATMASSEGAEMAAAALGGGADTVFVMGYDLHWSGSRPGASAPLRALGPGRSLERVIGIYERAGIPRRRMVLGLPLYGMSWPVRYDADGEAVRTGRGASWFPRDEFARLRELGIAGSLDPIAQAYRVDYPLEGERGRVAWYDTPATLAAKVGFAKDQGLGGVGFWALGYERDSGDWWGPIIDALLASPPPDR